MLDRKQQEYLDSVMEIIKDRIKEAFTGEISFEISIDVAQGAPVFIREQKKTRVLIKK